MWALSIAYGQEAAGPAENLIFKNFSLPGRDIQPVELPSSAGGLYFVANKTLDSGTFFSGLIDDVRIYN